MYRKQSKWIVLLSITFCAFLLSSTVAIAFEQQKGVAEGNLEIAAYVSISNSSADDSSDDVTMGIAAGSIGYFISDPIEIGTSFSYQLIDAGGSDSSQVLFQPFLRYHFFPSPMITPYLGVSLALGKIDYGTDDISLYGVGVSAGLNYFFKENVAIGPELRYDYLTAETNAADDLTMHTIGLYIFLKAYF